MRYYVYELVIKPDNKVCYVGKGSGNRMHRHIQRASRPTPPKSQRLLYTKLRQILEQGKQLVPHIVYETDDETDALLKEAEHIRHFGFENLLNNATHAFLGRRLKPEVKRILAERTRTMWLDPDYRLKNKTNSGKKLSYTPRPHGHRPHNRIGPSGFKGVSRWKAKGKSIRWVAKIHHNGKRLLGYFRLPEEAAKVYDDEFEKIYEIRPNGTQKTANI